VVLAIMIGLMIGSFRVLWPWPDGVGIVSEESDEAVDGTQIEWPDGDALWPIVFAVVAFIAVLSISLIGERIARRDAETKS
jgi:hypothetical protein